ncbi:MAG TPA: DUF4276 family protein [Bryobacteraceae bacterium]|nr:DUF4276 family protein [Bryobacteraceae bacterium]
MKIALHVEGETERHLPEFFKRWLDPKLVQPIGIHPIVFEGVQDYLRHACGRARRDLESGALIGGVGLIDLYGSGLTYPDGTIEQKYRAAKHDLERRVAHPRFRQHFAVHETEAWLFSDTAIFPDAIASELPKTANPETINFQNPPSKRLKDLYFRKLSKKYKKPVEGSSMFRKLDPEKAYARCPFLQVLLDDLLELAHPGA